MIFITLYFIHFHHYHSYRQHDFVHLECLQTSATFIQNMDNTANPCEDFFQYMCGNFENEHPLPDTSTSHDW